jgi:hypothetical protein
MATGGRPGKRAPRPVAGPFRRLPGQVRDQYVDHARPPASTAVEIRRLVRDDLLVEVDAVAILPS